MKQFINTLLLLIFLAFCSHPSKAQEQRNAATIDSLLQVVLHNDQKVRHDYNQSHDPKEKEVYLRQWDRTDSINQSIILPIVDSIINGRLEGLPDSSWRACFMVLQHADTCTTRQEVSWLELEDNERGFILMVKANPSRPETGNIKIYANRQYRGTTDKDGLLMFKTDKKEDIQSLRLVSSDGKEWTHTLKPFSQEQDYIIEGI